MGRRKKNEREEKTTTGRMEIGGDQRKNVNPREWVSVIKFRAKCLHLSIVSRFNFRESRIRY